MNLAQQVKKYIKHKQNIADNSLHYLNFQRLAALQRCHVLMHLFCFQLQHLTKHDIARYVLQYKNDLFMILPHEENKSYKSQLAKLDTMIAYCNEVLKPKTQNPQS